MNLRIASYMVIFSAVLAGSAIDCAFFPVRASAPPEVRHVFVIVLENEGYATTFGSGTKAPYLANVLGGQGALLSQYFGTAHFSLGNYIAMISGQSGTQQTRDDCEEYADFALSGVTPDGQAIGQGCVYPTVIKTLVDQLQDRGLTWRGYMEDLGNDPQREPATCGQPSLNAPDPTQAAEAPSIRVPRGDQYAARHNPFVYFHSIIDSPSCARHVVNLSHLERDLSNPRLTPNFAFILPNLCHDGHDMPCKDGEPGGLVSADAFLRVWVPRILASRAYLDGGLLLITFDEGETPETSDGSGAHVISSAGEKCCNQQPGPNIGPFPQQRRDGDYIENFADFGGDRTGAVLLAPFLQPGQVSVTPFNHYSLLKTIEDCFGIREHLGYAGQSGLIGFFDIGSDLRLRPHRRTMK